MPRDSGRNRKRSRVRSNGRSPPRPELHEFEIAQQKVRELEEQLQQKDIKLAQNAKRLGLDYGFNVDFNTNGYDHSPQNEGYMSPIRVGVMDDHLHYDVSSPIRIITPEPYRNASPPRFDYPRHEFKFENTSLRRNEIIDQFPYEQQPVYDNLNIDFNTNGYVHSPRRLPTHFHENVRVDEIPRWPMEQESPSISESEQRAPMSYSPLWRNQEEVQIDPMPVFPMDDEEPKNPTNKRKTREERARLQMELLAQQAKSAAIKAEKEKKKQEAEDQERIERQLQKERERAILEDEQRIARHHVRKIRDQVLEEMENKKKEKEHKKREVEREKRHALKRKQEEEENMKKKLARREYETFSHQSEVDEYFLKYLNPAIGDIKCESTRIEGKKPTEYQSKCHAVNIPKELLYGSKTDEIKGNSYKGAICNYVAKFVSLGIINEKTRSQMREIKTLPKFLAELVESLCNDVAIFGTQISVTDTPDMRSKFNTFAREKSSEFWGMKENEDKLAAFLRKNEPRRTNSSTSRTSPKPRDRKEKDNDRRDRRSSRERRKRSPSPNNEESLKMLFASHRNAANANAAPIPVNNFVQQQQQPGIPSLMNMSMVPPINPPVMNSYIQSQNQFYPPQPTQFDSSTMPGYSSFPQQHQMMQGPPMNPSQFNYSQQMNGFAQSGPRRAEDIDLMDEIFS